MKTRTAGRSQLQRHFLVEDLHHMTNTLPTYAPHRHAPHRPSKQPNRTHRSVPWRSREPVALVAQAQLVAGHQPKLGVLLRKGEVGDSFLIQSDIPAHDDA